VLADVLVEDFGCKRDLWRFERIVLRDLDVKLENATVVRSFLLQHQSRKGQYTQIKTLLHESPPVFEHHIYNGSRTLPFERTALRNLDVKLEKLKQVRAFSFKHA